MTKTCVVTGAGSGVGQAIAIALARQGWRVALVGRRPEALNETAKLASADNDQFLHCPCDVADLSAVERMAKRVLGEFKEVEVLVNSAATNATRRVLEVLSLEDYHPLIQTNLTGVYYFLRFFLPQMPPRRSGTI